MQFEQNLIEAGNSVTLRGVSSFTPEGNLYSERTYKSIIQKVYDNGRLKLMLPVEYGDVVPLSLDMIYEIVIKTEQDTFRGKGRILSRFRDEGGSTCIFRLTDALSCDTRKKYLQLSTRIPVKYIVSTEGDTGHGVITNFSLDRLVMETNRYLEDKTGLRMEAIPENMRELIFEGEVRESLKISSDVYESEVSIDPGDIRQQKELARWFLRHANDEPDKGE